MLDWVDEVIDFKKTVVRNTPILKPETDEFDDLADDVFDHKFVHRFIQDTTAIHSEKVTNHAIDYVFSQHNLPPSRFCDGSFSAWYASLDTITTFYETTHRWITEFLQDITFDKKIRIFQERTLFHVDCAAMLIDLRKKSTHMPALVSKQTKDYETTRLLGKTLYEKGSAGLYTLSARHSSGENIVVYNKALLNRARVFSNVLYEFDPQTKQVLVRDHITEKMLLEI